MARIKSIAKPVQFRAKSVLLLYFEAESETDFAMLLILAMCTLYNLYPNCIPYHQTLKCTSDHTNYKYVTGLVLVTTVRMHRRTIIKTNTSAL